MTCHRPPGLCAALLTLAAATTAHGQQIAEATDSWFPSPDPLEWSNQVTAGDLDGDGDLDLVIANGGNFSSPGLDQKVRIYLNYVTASRFRDVTDERTGGHAGIYRGVELGDCDNDGDLDILLAQDFDRLPGLLINDGNAFFTSEGATRLPAIALSSSRGQFGDVDNDGDLDIFLPSGTGNRFGCGQYRLYLNDGTCHYIDATATHVPLGNVCENMDAIFGDIDNDFDLDIRTASTGSGNSRLYRNDGTGVFTLDAGAPPDTTCYSYDFGDIDRDGDLDLLGANGFVGSSAEILLENDGTGSFTNVSSRITPNPNQDDNDSKFLDYDNDGDLDLIIARLGSGGEKLYENDGNGNFAQTSGVIEVISDSSLDIVVGDFDNSGSYDVVTVQGESGDYTNRIYLNSGPPDTIPPRIIDTEQHPDTPDTSGPYIVRALILDDMTSDRNFFDRGVTLLYSVDGATEQTAPMRYSGGQLYRGEIPGQSAGSSIAYRLNAVDYNDNSASGPSGSFSIVGAPADSAGTIDGPLLLGKAAGSEIELSWGESCDPGDLDYAIYSGVIGAFADYSPLHCSTAGAISIGLVPGPGSRFYLVVPRNVAHEGFYGSGFGDVGRPPSASACLEQFVGSCR